MLFPLVYLVVELLTEYVITMADEPGSPTRQTEVESGEERSEVVSDPQLTVYVPVGVQSVEPIAIPSPSSAPISPVVSSFPEIDSLFYVPPPNVTAERIPLPKHVQELKEKHESAARELNDPTSVTVDTERGCWETVMSWSRNIFTACLGGGCIIGGGVLVLGGSNILASHGVPQHHLGPTSAALGGALGVLGAAFLLYGIRVRNSQGRFEGNLEAQEDPSSSLSSPAKSVKKKDLGGQESSASNLEAQDPTSSQSSLAKSAKREDSDHGEDKET